MKNKRTTFIFSALFTIALLIGDNLGDFTHDFQLDKCTDRDKLVSERQEDFGKKWIVLPNAIYGKWTNNFGLYEKGIDQDSLIRMKLKVF